MNRFQAFAAALAAGAALAAAPALALEVSSAAHLNLRSGPGPQYAVVATINYGDRVDVTGCLDGITWCSVVWNGVTGWAAAEYLTVADQGSVEQLSMAGSDVGIPIVTYTAVDAVQPVFVGTVTPVAITDTKTLTTTIQPDAAVSAYVSTQTVQTTYLNGEVVLGSVIPQEVPLYAVPQSIYTFTNVNGQNVLVKNDTRQVVHIYR